jgi:hypothetical protein
MQLVHILHVMNNALLWSPRSDDARFLVSAISMGDAFKREPDIFLSISAPRRPAEEREEPQLPNRSRTHRTTLMCIYDTTAENQTPNTTAKLKSPKCSTPPCHPSSNKQSLLPAASALPLNTTLPDAPCPLMHMFTNRAKNNARYLLVS